MKTKFVIIISYIILCTSCNTQSNSNNTLNITLDSQSYLYGLLEKEKPLKNDEFYKEMIDEFSDLFDAEVKEINYSRGIISIRFCDVPSVMEVTDDFMEDAICIEFPSGVTTIRGFAWPTLKNIELPEGLKVIGMGAFSGCTQLTSINIPSSVIAIGERDRWYNTPPFQDCINLKNIKLSEGLQTISYGSFTNCSDLSTIKIPSSVKELGYAFDGCTSLKNVELSEGIEIIDGTFANCKSLTSINIPSSVKKLGAFYGCTSLKKVKLHEGLEVIDIGAFEKCIKLTSINIPSSVMMIGEIKPSKDYGYFLSGPFQDCINLKNVKLSEGLQTIGYRTFENCSSLTTIKLPSSIQEIGFSAFKNCRNLKSVEGIEEVIKIENGAFEGCTNLVSINMP